MNDLILKEIPDFSGYKAGSDGYIYSYLNTKLGGYNYNKKPKKLKGSPFSTGRYLRVVLRKNGKSYTVSVHRLICKTFNGESKNGLDCSHLDGNDKNNVPTNLVWETRKDNLNRRKDHGTEDIGIKNSRALFNLEQLLQIRKWLKDGVFANEIARRMDCNERDIGKIKRGERYKGQGELV